MNYDGAGRLSSLTHGASQIASGENWNGTSTLPASLGSSDLLAAYTYQYHADNRLTQFSTYRDGTSTAYGHDVRDQLTSAATTAISRLSQPFGLASAESYDFDAGGNRKSSGGASQSAANTHNQLQTDGTYNYTYDDEGNTLSRILISTGAVTLYEWDHRNRLESITEKTSAVGSVTQKIQYIYDALDQRVGKRLDSDGDGDFDRDEVFIWTEGQTVLRATDSDGEAATETFTLASRYLYGDMVDQLLADEQYSGGTGPDVSATTASATAGDTYWALTDHLGSVRDMVDNSGVIRQHVAYDSFGNRIVEQDYDASGTAISSSHADAIDELFGYTGRDWDADAGLQNNRARWYDPATGRWLSNDPIGFAAGDANLYRYVGNGPTTKTDPSGLEPPNPTFAIPPSSPGMGHAILANRARQIRNAESARLKNQYLNLISNTQKQHQQFAYYDLLNLGSLFERLKDAAGCVNFSPAGTPDGEYSRFTNTIYLNSNHGADTAIHEGIHAVDDIANINFRPSAILGDYPWWSEQSSLDRGEGLAYVTTAIAGEKNSLASSLGEFEQTLRSNASDYDVTRDWFLLWKSHSSPSNYFVSVPGEGNRKGTNQDMQCATENFGIRIDWIRFANFYSYAAQSQGRNIWLPVPSDDAFAEHQRRHFEKKAWYE
ncbi:RHS repeat-associated core domain-containing protein [Allorhodopirellula solitaria]|uniref:Putative deoxyribonuclease RhsB n=1 Tax=Allorhodopirellula solitaria TaxID=2527987 RepID=A0A5C5YJT9_9BACT|nr:RHS repeat-associated core domain-containing protein [Allorhodopirellula solitaria]TWT75087.1 putative deoxyribonuclease RhsB [Allorhodopirellula solitaria]